MFTPRALARLAQWFDELDAALEAARVRDGATPCRACGRCCRFDEMDHVLYATAWETALWLERSGTFPERIRPDDRRCPYQVGNDCRAREGRPLGCRIFTCGWDGEALMDFSAVWHDRLKRLHDEWGFPWDYAPLLRRPELPWR